MPHLPQGARCGETATLETRGEFSPLRVLVRLLLLLVSFHVRALVAPHGETLTTFPPRWPPLVGLEQRQGHPRLPRVVDARKKQQERLLKVVLRLRLQFRKLLVHRPGFLPLLLLGLLTFTVTSKRRRVIGFLSSGRPRSQRQKNRHTYGSACIAAYSSLVYCGSSRISSHFG